MAYFSYYSDLSGAYVGVANNDDLYDVSGASAGRIAYSSDSSLTTIGTVVDGSGNISSYTIWNVLDSSGNLLAGGPYNNGEGSSNFTPGSLSLGFFLYPFEAILSYYSNFDDAIAGAAANDYLTDTLGGATNRFAYSVFDISGTVGNPINGGSIGSTTNWSVYDTSGNPYAGGLSNNAAIPAGSSAWYLYPTLMTPYFSYYSDISGAYSGVSSIDYSTNTRVAGNSTYRIALSPASSSTQIGQIEIGGDISGYTSWNVLDIYGNLLAGGPYDNGDTSGNFTPPSGSQAFYLYPYEAPNVVSVLSYYSNYNDALAGAANNDYLTSTLGGATNRFAYSLVDISGTIGNPVDGGSIESTDTWNLYDISGNAYSGNPVSNNASIPNESIAWYLSPIGSAMAYFSYYADISGANAGVNNQDGKDTMTVDGVSTYRIACLVDGPIGDIEIGGDISGYTSWNVLDESGNLLAGGPYDNGDTSGNFTPPNLSANFYLYPYEAPNVVSVLSYYSNTADALAGAANNDYLTSTLGGATNRFAYSLVDISGTIGSPLDGGSTESTTIWNLYDISGNAYSGNPVSNNAPIPNESIAWYLSPPLVPSYFSYYADISGAIAGVINLDGPDSGTVDGHSTYRIANLFDGPIGDIEIGGDISGYTSWNVLDSSGNLLAGGPYDNGDTSGNFTPPNLSANFYLYPYEAPNVVSVLSYYSNYNDALAGAANNDYLTSTIGGATNRFAYSLFDISGTIGSPLDGGSTESTTIWNLYDISGNAYSGNPVSNSAPIPNESIAWYLSPISLPSYFSYYLDISDAIAGVNNLDGPDSSTVDGISTLRLGNLFDGPIGDIEIGGYLYNYTSWNVLDSSGNLLAGGPYDNGDTSGNFTPPNLSANFYLYPYFPPNVVSVLSYYSNYNDALAGAANNDYLTSTLGGATNRFAYSLVDISGTIGSPIDGGSIGTTITWNLYDISGNAYSGNPVSNSAPIPNESIAWYLVPDIIEPYFSYYSDISGANSGVINNDRSSNTTVAGTSTYRIALSPASSSTQIGQIEIGGDISGYTSWNVLDSSGNLLEGGPYTNTEDSSNFFPASDSPNFYLYPYEAPVVAYFSYYSNVSDANAGVANNDELYDTSGATVDRIAYSAASSSTEIGAVVDGSGNISGITSWNVLDTAGNLVPGGPYTNTQDSTEFGYYSGGSAYFLYPYTAQAPCFLEGSQILCLVDEKETYLPIEQMRKGTLVKTLNSGYKMVHIIGKRDIPNFNDSARIKDRLYKLTSVQYPALTSDLYLTGCHSTLVDSLTEEQKEEIKKMLGVVCVTEGKYRLPASVDQKAEPWQSKGTYTVWHFALDDENPLINFGVYANGGLIVETGSIRYLQEKANMELV